MKLPKEHIIRIIKNSERELDITSGLYSSLGRIHASKKTYNRKKLKQQMKKEYSGLTW
jgi:hypothetical protein